MPDVASRCRALSLEQIRIFEASPDAWSSAPRAYKELAEISQALTHFGAHHASAGSPSPRPRHIPGRKWQQIERLQDALAGHLAPKSRIVDWCGGKGHLGRTLAKTFDAHVLVLERQAALCHAAKQLADDVSIPLTALNVDVLEHAIALEPNDQIVGLHACGRLTDRLLDVAHESHAQFAAAASCCYHATIDGEFHAQSQRAAQVTAIPIDRHALRLVTADEVVARPTIKRRREREHAFRLGLDLLVREATGRDEYSPLPSIPGKLIEGRFDVFCRTLSEKFELPLPASFSPTTAETAGWERSKQARALGLVRALFRRPLELWLVLDRALAALERERYARIIEFCDRQVTPRNLLLMTSSARL